MNSRNFRQVTLNSRRLLGTRKRRLNVSRIVWLLRKRGPTRNIDDAVISVGVADGPMLDYPLKGCLASCNQSDSCDPSSLSSSVFRPTLRGLTTGSLMVADSSSTSPCLVFGTSFNRWLPVLSQLGFHAVGVVVTDTSCLEAIRLWVSPTCRIFVSPQWTQGFPLPLPTAGPVGFLDCRFTHGVASLFESAGLHQVLSLGGFRRSLPGWNVASFSIEVARDAKR